jgi:hypothetical protein
VRERERERARERESERGRVITTWSRLIEEAEIVSIEEPVIGVFLLFQYILKVLSGNERDVFCVIERQMCMFAHACRKLVPYR